MSFVDLPLQPALNPAADIYADQCLDLSKAAIAEHAMRTTLDVPYGQDYWQKLDIFAPAQGGRDLPVLVFFHGGGWTHGYKEWCGFMAPVLLQTPAILVSVSYRLLPQSQFPAPFDDAWSALRWVHQHITGFGGDPQRLHVGGHSAGGQLASMLAVRHEQWPSHGLPSDAIKACFCISTTFNRRVVNEAIAPHLVTSEDPDDISPETSLHFAGQAKVPFLIIWGGRENPRYPKFSQVMVERLRAAGCDVRAWCVEDSGHFDIHLDTGEAQNPWTRAVVSFMRDATFGVTPSQAQLVRRPQ